MPVAAANEAEEAEVAESAGAAARGLETWYAFGKDETETNLVVAVAAD